MQRFVEFLFDHSIDGHTDGVRAGKRNLLHHMNFGSARSLICQVWFSQHLACPFGATASVHAWERLGAAICHIARRCLGIALLQYVDDYFAPERGTAYLSCLFQLFIHRFANRPQTMQHALHCFARVVRVLLGPSAVANGKLECGISLCILGVELRLAKKGFQCRPAIHKIKKWLKVIERALQDDRLLPGDASKLAGRLAWGCSRLFRKLGRAMLRPIFNQKCRRDGKFSAELKRALLWWKAVLTQGLAETREWATADTEPLQLFCDARGQPPVLAAVMVSEQGKFYTYMDAPASILCHFKRRADNQIMGLELLAISLGLSTFCEMLSHRNTVVHSDNTGSEVSAPHLIRRLCVSVCIACASVGSNWEGHGKVLGPRPTGARTVAASCHPRHGLAHEKGGDRYECSRPAHQRGFQVAAAYWCC